MARRVIWTHTAWSDLEAVADYIAKDSRHYAAACVGGVRDAARSLASLAERGRMVPEFHDLGLSMGRETCGNGRNALVFSGRSNRYKDALVVE